MIKRDYKKNLASSLCWLHFFSSFLKFFLDEVPSFVVLSFLSVYGSSKNRKTKAKIKEKIKCKRKNKIQNQDKVGLPPNKRYVLRLQPDLTHSNNYLVATISRTCSSCSWRGGG